MQAQDLSRIIEMAWEDRTPFEAIEQLYGLNESAVIRLMRQTLNPNSFKLWRKRVTGRKTKHLALRGFDSKRRLGILPSLLFIKGTYLQG